MQENFVLEVTSPHSVTENLYSEKPYGRKEYWKAS